jgi:naphtho-gamma-pyrone polyketide synthase
MDELIQSTAFMPPVSDSIEPCQFLLFGDLTVTFDDDLRQLLHVKGNEILQSFLNQVGYTFRQEFGKLPAGQQDLFPRFTNIVDLVSKLGETEGTPILRFALLTLYEIGQFFRYVHDQS